MSTLKGILFNQVASDALHELIEELQHKFKPKKGRRFNHNNITYEISRPAQKGNALEFEISSKIPQEEVDGEKAMKAYFSEIKKRINAEKIKPVSIEMENIVWDSRKDSEKERDYVKLLYSYPLDELFDNKNVEKDYEKYRNNPSPESLPPANGAMTTAGRLVLAQVKEAVREAAKTHALQLVEANKEVREALGKKG